MIAESKKTYTKSFARDVIYLAREMPVLAIARLYDVSWGMVCDILKGYLEKRYPKKNIKNLRRIAIDEICIGKRHKYLTIVLDLDTGDPVYVGDGKAESALVPFWKLLGPKRAKKIKCVSMDMGRAFQAAVKKNIPDACIVFDHFHVVKLANECLDQLRRQEYSRVDFEGKQIIKGSRYLLLKNPENLDSSRKEPERLQQLLALNTPLSMMYILKEDLRQFWHQISKEEAEAAIDVWVETAKNSGVPHIVRLGKCIERYKEGILNYYVHRVSSGPLEGFNNKVKVLARRAYGYRNIKFFKLLILAIGEFSPREVVIIHDSS
jgi:transposase